MLETYSKLLDLLTPRERRRFYLLLALILGMGFAQMLGVAAVLPFLAVLSNPDIVETNARLAAIHGWLGFTSDRAFLMFLGGCVFVVLVLSLLFKTFTQYAIFRFATMRGFTVSSRLLQGYLQQPYAWFLNHHSADLGTRILMDVNKVISQALMPAMRILSYAMVVFFLVALLVVIEPVAAFVLAFLLGGSYVAVYFTVRQRLMRIGEQRHEANNQRFEVSADAIGGIKDVKLLGLEASYVRRFQQPALRVAECDATSAVIGEVPRYLLEIVAFGGMLLFILFLLARGDGTLDTIVPVLGVYAFAALRMFPALQGLYAAFTALRFARPTLDRLHGDMVENGLGLAPVALKPPSSARPMLRVSESLEIDGLHYAYPKSERPAVRDLDMTIPARTTVGIVGGSGAGKTTTVDLLLGLLTPQQGRILVDGAPITDANRREWQNAIGYVPQQIFLTDDTVSANIAFGIDARDIDQAAVERAARVAELHDFVMREMPDGYATEIGERGVRLSGGQRQRIGIARALYHDPDVLIMDEATSALDNLTERAVMDAVHNLGHAKTIILIAHRLTTVRNCDIIFMMEQGRVIAAGTYDELVRDSDAFRAMSAGVS